MSVYSRVVALKAKIKWYPESMLEGVHATRYDVIGSLWQWSEQESLCGKKLILLPNLL